MNACSAGGFSRRSAECLPLVVLAVLVCSAAGASCPDDTKLKQRSAGDTTGNFLSGTISWTHVSGNKVRFELVSTWRRAHHWPCMQGVGFSGPDGLPGIGDHLTIVGLSTVESGQARQEKLGAVSTKLWTGDGKYHELQLEVTSYSKEEDWVMGISYLEYEYSAPHSAKVPLYQMNGQALHYVSSPEDKESTQPYKTVPWNVEFKGCCRRFLGKKDKSPNFSIRATVDLSNHIASPRIVLMPFLYTAAGGSQLSVCALSAGGRKAMVRKNGGTINYLADDNTPATFSWSANATSVLVKPSSESKDGRCMVLSVGLSQPQYQVGDRDILSIEVKMGDATVTGDYMIYVKGPDAISMRTSSSAPFGCPLQGAICEGDISLGKKTPIFSGQAPLIDFEAKVNAMTPLEVRYIVATSSHQSTLLSTSQGTVQYSLTEIGQDHAGLPRGATLAPTMADTYVTNLEVIFTADKENTRPGVDQFISNEQRDYTSHFTAGTGWYAVAGTNFNAGVGGAHVAVYVEKAKTKAGDPTNLAHLAAITGLELANPSQVDNFVAKGYHKLDRNLLEQSDRGEIFIMYKKGSGPPVMDVRATQMTGYKKITASTSHANGKMATATLYVRYSLDSRVARSLFWAPCTGQDEEVIICATANAWNVSKQDSTAAYGSPMQCMLMDVVPTTPPVFSMPINQIYDAYMGKELEIELRFKRTDDPLTANELVPKIRFGIKGSDSTQPTDPDSVLKLLTGRTKTGSRIMNADKTALGLSVDAESAADNANNGESKGFLLWTPSPYQGGWTGEVCLDACVDTSACPALPGGAEEVCSQTCFKVTVERCKWALQGEDSFVEIAPRFQTNWLQLWFLNPMVGHPDHAHTLSNQVAPATMINVGRIYKPRWDDTMATVADRFGMSVQRLIDLNADLASMSDADFIKEGEGKDLCIIPDSCSLEAPSNSGKNA